MITTEYFEDENFKEIYYRDERDVAFRHLIMDLQGNIIQDSLSEFRDDGKTLTDVTFASDHLTKYAFRQYLYDENGDEIGFDDYHVINGENVLVAKERSEWIEKDKIAKSYFYNANDEVVYYILYKDDNDGCGMTSEGYYDKNGNRLEYEEYSKLDEKILLYFQYYLNDKVTKIELRK